MTGGAGPGRAGRGSGGGGGGEHGVRGGGAGLGELRARQDRGERAGWGAGGPGERVGGVLGLVAHPSGLREPRLAAAAIPTRF